MKRFMNIIIIAGLAGMLLATSVFGQAYDTEGYNRGKNMTFRDKNFSPQRGASVWELSPQLAMLDPVVGITFYKEFADGDTAFTDSWIVGFNGVTSASSVALIDTTGGWIEIKPAANDDDIAQLQTHQEMFKFASNKPLIYEARVSLTDATESDMIVGLIITSSNTPSAQTDGVYFRKDDGDANLDYVMEKNSTTTLSTGDTGSDMADNTMVKLGIRYDGSSTVYWYINGTQVASATANIPDDEFLAPVFAVRNGEGSAKTLFVDYVKITQIR